jgi:hypothetical protein
MSTELEERLRQRMAYATAEIQVPRDLARRAARHRRRRTMVRVGAAAGTAAAVTVAVMVGTATEPPNGTDATATARLASDVESALDTATSGNYIMHTESSGGLRSWYYRGPNELVMRNEGFSSSGQPTHDDVVDLTPGGSTTISVDYAARKWFVRKSAGQRLPPVPAPRTSCTSEMDALRSLDPADIRESLACGELTNEGIQYVNGVHAIKLVAVRTEGIQATMRLTVTLWVDPATYLPTRYQRTLWGSQLRGHTPSVTENITWLPQTKANLTLLQVPIPAGFTQVPPPKQ